MEIISIPCHQCLLSLLQVVHEVASTLQTLRQAHPEEFKVAVQSLMPGELGAELLSMLENLKSRALDKQLLLMYDKIRAAQQQQQQQQQQQAR